VLEARAEKDSVALGDAIRVQVKLVNRSKKVVTVNKLRLAGNSVVLQVAFETRSFQLCRLYGKYQGNNYREEPPPVDALKAGAFAAEVIEVLALRTGKLRFTPVYGGLPRDAYPDPIQGSPFEVTVPPAKGGETRVGARIVTSKGAMKAELHPEEAYNTVHSFLSLARQGFYNNLAIPRVVKGFMVQTGSPTPGLAGGPGFCVPAEFNRVKHERGVLSMARSQSPNSAGSQFFIMHGTSPGLDGQYTAFGRVVEGLDVLEALASVPVKMMAGGPDRGPSEPVDRLGLEKVEMVLLPPAAGPPPGGEKK